MKSYYSDDINTSSQSLVSMPSDLIRDSDVHPKMEPLSHLPELGRADGLNTAQNAPMHHQRENLNKEQLKATCNFAYFPIAFQSSSTNYPSYGYISNGNVPLLSSKDNLIAAKSENDSKFSSGSTNDALLLSSQPLTDNNGHKFTKDIQKLNIKDAASISNHPGNSYAYVPLSFPTYGPNYHVNGMYGYVTNGLPSFPVYAYPSTMNDKANGGKFSPHMNQQYVAFTPQPWNNLDSVLPSINVTNPNVAFMGNALQNGHPMILPSTTLQHDNTGVHIPISQTSLLQGNGVSAVQNSPLVIAPNSIRNDAPYQMSNSTQNIGQPSIDGMNGIYFNKENTESNIGKTMTQDSGYLNLIPGYPQMVEPGSKMNQIDTPSDFSKFTDLNNGMANGVHAGIVTPSLTNGLTNHIPPGVPNNAIHGFQNSVPHLIPGTPTPHIVPNGFPNGFVGGIPNGIARLPVHINNGIAPNPIPGYLAKPPTAFGPHPSPGFSNLPNDVIFDPLTQAPVLWNTIPRTPFYIPPKEEDVMLSLPRDIHPPHFLNVYPITAVPGPTLAAISPMPFRPKRNVSEDPKKNRKYACKYCSKRFSRPSSLQTHTYTHTGERPFPCTLPHCGRSFSVLSNLRRHLHVCQKNIRKRSQFSESNTPDQEATNSAGLEPSEDNNQGDQKLEGEDSIPDETINQSTPFIGNRSSSSNYNTDTRSTDSGSEEAKNDSGLGGSVSSKDSSTHAHERGKDSK